MNDARQLPLVLIPHKVENALVEQRADDGYINATAMCKAVGKQFGDYTRLASTSDFVSALSADTGIPVSELIQSVRGGDPERQGSWVHPDLAIHLAQWLSPKFAVAVSKWVREWLAGGQFGGTSMPYHLRRYMANRAEIPYTHFSVLNELIFNLIAPLEQQGYTLPDHMVPDISQGKMFAKWLREEKGLDTDSMPTYPHKYADGRVVDAKMYPASFLEEFRKHFNEVWLPQKAEKYFKERDPLALPYLSLLLLPPPVPKAAKKTLAKAVRKRLSNS